MEEAGHSHSGCTSGIYMKENLKSLTAPHLDMVFVVDRLSQDQEAFACETTSIKGHALKLFACVAAPEQESDARARG